MNKKLFRPIYLTKTLIIFLVLVFFMSGCVWLSSDYSQDNNEPEKFTLDENKLKQKLTEFYKIYETKEFPQLANYLAADLDNYISLKNTTSRAIISDADNFFKNKTNIRYKPFIENSQITQKDNLINVKLGLNMKWTWQDKGFADGDFLYNKDVTVVTNISFDHNYQITNYIEEYIVTPSYEIINEPQNYVYEVDSQENYIYLDKGVGFIDGSIWAIPVDYKNEYITAYRKINFEQKNYWVRYFTFRKDLADIYGVSGIKQDPHISGLASNLPEEYMPLFYNNYFIEQNNHIGQLVKCDGKTLTNQILTTFDSGSISNVSQVLADRLIEITSVAMPEPHIYRNYYDMKYFKIISFPDENPQVIGYKDSRVYYLTNIPPMTSPNIGLYYCHEDEFSCSEELFNYVIMTNLDEYDGVIRNIYYKAESGILKYKETIDNQIILTESIIDQIDKGDLRDNLDEIAKLFLGESQIIVYLQKPVDTDLVGFKTFSLNFGREEFGALKTYKFSLPMYMTYEYYGEDARSSGINYKIDGQVVVSQGLTDYSEDESWIKESFKNKAFNYSFANGHTNVLVLDNDDAEEEYNIIKSSLTIDNIPVFAQK